MASTNNKHEKSEQLLDWMFAVNSRDSSFMLVNAPAEDCRLYLPFLPEDDPSPQMEPRKDKECRATYKAGLMVLRNGRYYRLHGASAAGDCRRFNPYELEGDGRNWWGSQEYRMNDIGEPIRTCNYSRHDHVVSLGMGHILYTEYRKAGGVCRIVDLDRDEKLAGGNCRLDSTRADASTDMSLGDAHLVGGNDNDGMCNLVYVT